MTNSGGPLTRKASGWSEVSARLPMKSVADAPSLLTWTALRATASDGMADSICSSPFFGDDNTAGQPSKCLLSAGARLSFRQPWEDGDAGRNQHKAVHGDDRRGHMRDRSVVRIGRGHGAHGARGAERPSGALFP